MKEVCQTVCKSLNLDDKKLNAIVADNCSAMRAALSSFTLDNTCDEDDLVTGNVQGEVDSQSEDIFTLNDPNDDVDGSEYVESLEFIPPSSMTRVIYMYGCLAHKIQLVIRDGLRVRQVEELVLKVKSIVSYIRRPRFRSFVKTVPLANDTRWSSCYHMIRGYLEHYDLIQDVLQTVNPRTKMRIITRATNTSHIGDNTEIKEIEVGMLKITDLEKEILHEICTLLKPFEVITQVSTI